MYALLSLPVGLAVSVTPISDLTQNPSPEAWLACARWLDKLPLDQRQEQVPIVKRGLKGWPHELPRPPLPKWTKLEHPDLLALCISINETDVYEHYMASIHGAPELKLSSGKPAVRLQRFFAGGAKVGRGDAFVKIGQAGQADLVGMLTVEVAGWPDAYPDFQDIDKVRARQKFRRAVAPFGQAQLEDIAKKLTPQGIGIIPANDGSEPHPMLLALYVEIEIKMPEGHQSEVQHTREEVIRSRGGIYLIVRSVKALVEGLVGERERVLGMLG